MEKLTVTVVLPNRTELQVKFPPEATPTDIIETLLNSPELDLPRFNKNNDEILYELTPKGKGASLLEHETLGDARVQNGDRLLLTKVVTAGGSHFFSFNQGSHESSSKSKLNSCES